MGKGREVSFNVSKCFSAFVKISPCCKFKKFKTNKATLTTIIGLKNILRSDLVKFALDKEDRSVPVYALLFNFLLVVSACNVFKYVLCLWIIRNGCNLFNRE